MAQKRANRAGGKPKAANKPNPTHQPRRLALRVMTLTRDTNQYGTVFGGIILSWIDQAAFVEARHHGVHRWVTASVDRVDFHRPVHLGDVVNFHATTIRLGTTSVTVRVDVEAERFTTGRLDAVTTATLTMVAVDALGAPIPFRTQPTMLDEHQPRIGPGAGSSVGRAQ